MESTVTPFSLGRRDPLVAVEIVRRLRLPGGGILQPGERVTLPAAQAARLLTEGFVKKSEDAPVTDKMQHRPMAKKGQE